jgi:hypothetical protein
MTKEELIKLAEVAGYDVCLDSTEKMYLCYSEFRDLHTCTLTITLEECPKSKSFKEWQPHKDIAQAFEVLEKYPNHFLSSHNGHYICNILDSEGNTRAIGYSSSVAPEDVICKAVLKALEAQDGK